jgi:hypothetical protein
MAYLWKFVPGCHDGIDLRLEHADYLLDSGIKQAANLPPTRTAELVAESVSVSFSFSVSVGGKGQGG